MANEYNIISDEALDALCGAIKGVVNAGEILDDTGVATNKTYSSFKIQEELDKKIDKDKVVTVLDDTVTDDEVASAKAVYDSVKDKNLKTYTALSQFNKTIDDINSLVDLCVSMGASSQFTISVNSSMTQTFYDKGLIPINTTGSLSVYNYNLRGYALYVSSNTIYIRNANNTTVDAGWNAWINMSENQLYVQPITSSTMDFNTYTKNGVYSFSTASSTLVNSPSLVNGWLMVLNDGGNAVKQIVYRLGTPNRNSFETYERLSADKGSTWSNWTLITNPSYVKTYTSLAQIGIPADKTATLSDIWTALGDGCMLIFETSQIADSEIPRNCKMGIYEIYKITKFRGCIRFTEKEVSGGVYSMGLASDGSPDGKWMRLCATTVADVSKKRMTFSNETYCKPINAEEGVVYEVKNGICFVHVKITNTLTSTNLQYKTFCTGLPKPSAGIGFSAIDRDFKGSGANFVLTLDGELQILCADTTNIGKYYTIFSYPVAE